MSDVMIYGVECIPVEATTAALDYHVERKKRWMASRLGWALAYGGILSFLFLRPGTVW
ncbi:hypothetical protein ASPFODRAFT_44127 [Aspergillus luchuensis CBS 106.47]|uniref:Uncharacterized protein n=1 Tax=Aspergillus luchuensis (strain CBS 106.47) TaxID=1137211 RepID=A0A1M3TNL5_ASPLC|nr:hypothetical protein ASPFODRAFT_44127 [Aspergillus luchuensis CBS 106.47]